MNQKREINFINQKNKYMLKQVKYILIVHSLFFFVLGFSQEQRQTKDTIDTDVVNVVKPYAPKVSDAFKIKEIPTLEDNTNSTKKEVRYNIFSIPVASTFCWCKCRCHWNGKDIVSHLLFSRCFFVIQSWGFLNLKCIGNCWRIWFNYVYNIGINCIGFSFLNQVAKSP